MASTFHQIRAASLRRLRVLLAVLGLLLVLSLLVFYLILSNAAPPAQEPAGAADVTFNPLDSANNNVLTVALQPDGKILIGGDFTSFQGTPRNRIARLASDGSLDSSFNPGSGLNSTVRIIVPQSDGKVLIGGFFTTFNGVTRNHLVRLNSDGSVDNSFNSTNNNVSGANGIIYAMAQQSDGKILIGGAFTAYAGTARNRIARLNSDGSLDSSFKPGSGFDGTISTLVLQGNGKILIGGQFFTYNNKSSQKIARLNSDGTLDSSFNPGSGASDAVHAIAVQANGQIVIGGWFLSYNGVSRKYLARLNGDGTLDSTFNPTTTDSGINVTLLQPDGKITIGGYFTTYGNTARTRIARLNGDGTLDSTFNPGSGANGDIFSMALQSDGKILVSGRFSLYNEKTPAYIVRLAASGR